MGRYILRYRGQGEMPREDVRRFRALPDVRLIDESSRMLLVEAPSIEPLRAAGEATGCWSISPEQSIELPPAHPNLSAGRAKRR